MPRSLLVLLWVLAFPGGEGIRAVEPTPAEIEFFESKVRPILIERCYSCHSNEAKKTKGNLSLDTREDAIKGGDLGPAIIPGKAAESRLVSAIKYQEPDLAMPPSGKLPPMEVAILSSWIDKGAIWPAKRKKNPEKEKALDEAKSHWAWQPLSSPVPPQVKTEGWAFNEIDRFVLSRLEARKMAPAHAADKRTLIRRAYLDLIGLPAPVAEVEAFVRDESPEAYEKLIDRLLATPQYGERWARYWLDVARYSDGYGGFLDGAALPDAWRYRDWVVKAFNADLPYDQFVKQQIAGDLLGKPEASIGTGFLAVGPTYNDDGGDPDSIAKTRAETLDDRVDTVTRAFLGLTVSCARCHDHKFDPVPQADYYSIAAVFNNTRNVHGPVGTPEELKKAQEHFKKIQSLEEQLKALSKDGADKSTLAARTMKLNTELNALRATAPSLYHCVAEAGSADMAIAIRGDLRKPGPVVPRRFLGVLSRENRVAWTQGSGRLQLAEAIASPSNPLTSRVMVNRVWQWHFGRGLVRTPGNFGLLGEKPSHPELLDWLAGKLVSSGWSLKTLHKTIMLSSTYRMNSQFEEANFRQDGDNRFLWRMNPRRLDVEAWRDCLYAVTEELNLTTGGPPAEDILNSQRRTLYSAVSRNGDRFASDQFLRLFDFPSARATVSERPTSAVPQQYLFLLNSPFMEARAKALAQRVLGDTKEDIQAIDKAYLLLYSRPSSVDEKKAALAFLDGDEAGKMTRWNQYAQVLLSSHEFMQIR